MLPPPSVRRRRAAGRGALSFKLASLFQFAEECRRNECIPRASRAATDAPSDSIGTGHAWPLVAYA